MHLYASACSLQSTAWCSAYVQNEEHTAADQEVMELADDAEKERMLKDPLYKLEQVGWQHG